MWLTTKSSFSPWSPFCCLYLTLQEVILGNAHTITTTSIVAESNGGTKLQQKEKPYWGGQRERDKKLIAKMQTSDIAEKETENIPGTRTGAFN